jgi:hypothetical protein
MTLAKLVVKYISRRRGGLSSRSSMAKLRAFLLLS